MANYLLKIAMITACLVVMSCSNDDTEKDVSAPKAPNLDSNISDPPQSGDTIVIPVEHAKKVISLFDTLDYERIYEEKKPALDLPREDIYRKVYAGELEIPTLNKLIKADPKNLKDESLVEFQIAIHQRVLNKDYIAIPPEYRRDKEELLNLKNLSEGRDFSMTSRLALKDIRIGENIVSAFPPFTESLKDIKVKPGKLEYELQKSTTRERTTQDVKVRVVPETGLIESVEIEYNIDNLVVDDSYPPRINTWLREILIKKWGQPTITMADFEQLQALEFNTKKEIEDNFESYSEREEKLRQLREKITTEKTSRGEYISVDFRDHSCLSFLGAISGFCKKIEHLENIENFEKRFGFFRFSDFPQEIYFREDEHTSILATYFSSDDGSGLKLTTYEDSDHIDSTRKSVVLINPTIRNRIVEKYRSLKKLDNPSDGGLSI